MSESPYGTYDQNGNVWEWNEVLISGVYRGLRGGSWGNAAHYQPSSYRDPYYAPTVEDGFLGFRVASSFTGDEGGAVPEPMSIGFLVTGLIGLVYRARNKA